MAAQDKQTDEPGQSAALSALGLNAHDLNASFHHETIRAAFRARIKQVHPDRVGGDDTALRRLILARDLLLHPARIASDAFDFDAPRLDSSALLLTIDMTQAIHGGQIRIEAPALEFYRSGDSLTSLTQMVQLHVTLPAGLRDDDKVRLPLSNGGHARFHIRIAPGDDMRVWGDDIWMTAWLDPYLLRYGGAAMIDTPAGPQSIQVDRDIPHGASLCLKGKGLPASETAPAGDLYIRLEALPLAGQQTSYALNAFRQRWAS
ncbi:DnaJ C-terminal domain-containing protein [Asticcacaulis sp. EMRT-3]|uniref:DnaJ C-terminal domain-containing protein n=1 Tax=Asticcacaulis sp. EMRT-3 TaxID=3040349 RepID=UPI0024AF7BDE|nr:DnaJ C-terminal domain-containing protein [Asticcacaulis sp. EMRT-3]MDI7774445.1 DnaJ C-terminal domain-containing protein [Asticcacaulis sp. EMRT-3]